MKMELILSQFKIQYKGKLIKNRFIIMVRLQANSFQKYRSIHQDYLDNKP